MHGRIVTVGAAVLVGAALLWLVSASSSRPGAPVDVAAAPEPNPPAPTEAEAEPGERPRPRLEAPAAAARAPRPEPDHGNKPDRDRRWQERMSEVERRARIAIRIDDRTAAELMTMQRGLRAYKHEVRRKMAAGLSMEEAGPLIRQRVAEFEQELEQRIGAARTRTYLLIVDQVRAGDPGRKVARR